MNKEINKAFNSIIDIQNNLKAYSEYLRGSQHDV